MLLQRGRSGAAYSVSSDYRYPPKLQSLLRPSSRISVCRTGRRRLPQRRGPRLPRTWQKHNGGVCQKTRQSRSTSLAEREPVLSQLSCRHPSCHRTLGGAPGSSMHQIPMVPTFRIRSTTMLSALCHLSRRCHRCVRIMTDRGAFRSRFQGHQESTITHWTLQTRHRR